MSAKVHPRDKLLTMSPRALRVVAARWFLAGFAQSGVAANGETMNPSTHAHGRRLLLVEFNRLFGAERLVANAAAHARKTVK